VVGPSRIAFGAFSYRRETHHASVGPMEVLASEQRTVNVPVWAGAEAIPDRALSPQWHAPR
jgi:hypothetical protein